MEISDLKKLCTELKEQKNKISELKNSLQYEQEHYDNLKMRIIHILNDNNLKTFASDDVKITKVDKLNVTIKDEKQFTEYLKNNGLDHLRRVPHNTLQGLYREFMEIAVEKGQTEFSIPGVDVSSHYETLQIRKA